MRVHPQVQKNRHLPSEKIAPFAIKEIEGNAVADASLPGPLLFVEAGAHFQPMEMLRQLGETLRRLEETLRRLKEPL
jgi:hypothetical protein